MGRDGSMVKVASLTYAQQGMDAEPVFTLHICPVVFSYLVPLVTRGTSIYFCKGNSSVATLESSFFPWFGQHLVEWSLVSNDRSWKQYEIGSHEIWVLSVVSIWGSMTLAKLLTHVSLKYLICQKKKLDQLLNKISFSPEIPWHY